MTVEYVSVPLEVKSLKSGEFEGYGSTFGNLDHGDDVIVQGAFTKSLADYGAKGKWPKMFWSHQIDEFPPGKWLEMREDPKGLYVRGKIIKTRNGEDLKVALDEGAVDSLSIGFSIDAREDFTIKDGIRYLKAINLWEVSPVNLPMNPEATIDAVKARLEQRGISLPEFKRELEAFLRDKGLSRSQATLYASRALASATQRDAAAPVDESSAMLQEEPPSAMLEGSQRDAGAEDTVAFLQLVDEFIIAERLKRLRFR